MIRCPYHSWVYDLDGALVAAPHIEADALCKQEFSLYPVGVDTWGGFIFVHLTPQNAEPLSEALGAAVERTRVTRSPALRIGHTIQYVIDANWKVSGGELQRVLSLRRRPSRALRRGAGVSPAGGASLDWDRGIPHREGAVTYTRSGTTTRRPFPA